jgi:hypothetical protein
MKANYIATRAFIDRGLPKVRRRPIIVTGDITLNATIETGRIGAGVAPTYFF